MANLLIVQSVAPEQTHEWLTRVHYAKRVPQIVHAFGLYDEGELVGVVTYGIPSSAPLREGIAGEEYSHRVIELNRLCLIKLIRNGASMLVGRSLKMLPKPRIIVSYADTEQGHVGYVYQACNFLYTGLSAKRTDWKVKGMENLHGQTIADMSKGASGQGRGSRAQYMREKFGDDFYLEDRARKHRYLFVHADKRDKQQILKAIRYPTEPYPKGETSRYEIDHQPATQGLLFF